MHQLSHYLFNNTLWMGWNIMLALIPFLLAQHLFKPKSKITWGWSLGFLAFILFLPNAPYLFTDIIHWYGDTFRFSTVLQLFVMTVQFWILMLAGYVLFVTSYRRFETFILKKFDFEQGVLRLVTFIIVSVGVYLGRFIRLNSWDAIFQPKTFLKSIYSLHHSHALIFIAAYTGLLFALYFFYEKVQRKSFLLS